MPKLARDYDYNRFEYPSACNQNSYITSARVYSLSSVDKTRLKRTKKKKNPFKFIRSLLIVSLLLMSFMPYAFNKITKSVFVPNPYKNIKTDMYEFAFPTSNYLSNNWFMGRRTFNFAADKKDASMLTIREGVNMPSLQAELLSLMEEYPTIKPAIYVWDYESQNYVDINGSKIFPVASIIKIPVLISLFKSFERNEISLVDKIPLTEYYRTEGSGDLQFKAANSLWSVDELARIMITNSDNSATNMIMANIGSMNGVNQSIRDWGLKNTRIQAWLPDMRGTNHSTAKELAQMLYNIDSNEEFLSDKSRNKIYDYMSHVHNDRLIQAGLGKGSVFYHKTGDIGTMLGDAGIVVAPNGARYIVVILAHRPHNSVLGKDFIVKASEIVYNYMVR